jgi:cysteinyl-tRNA synthetase
MQQVVNFTDVDDKTIAGARKAGLELRAYTDQYIAAFHEDTLALGIESVEEMPRATDEANLKAMVKTIQRLEQRGHTYQSNGSIYFKISTLSSYGKLARLDHEGMQDGARVDSDDYAKENARDFALWKASGPDEPSWDFGVGPGRPGWHIECSAMALRLLDGAPIDIHAGGVDLIFPHHENEIAQSEGSTGETFSRFWFHVEHLLLDKGIKMSKSIGNVLSVKEILSQGYRASALRYVLLSTHYRKQLRFTWDSLAQAEESLRRLMDCLGRLDTVTAASSSSAFAERVESACERFDTRMADDLNTPGALGVVFELVRDVNAAVDAGTVSVEDVLIIRKAFDKFDEVLGVIALRRVEDEQPPVEVEEIERLVEERNAARRGRDFSLSDQIRDDLDDRGVILEDTPTGTRWKRK